MKRDMKDKFLGILKDNAVARSSVAVMCAVVLALVSQMVFFRIDLTEDGRYSVSGNTKRLVEGIDGEVVAKVYLDGDLNPGFMRLKKATREMLEELRICSRGKIKYEFVNPSMAENAKKRESFYGKLEKRGMARVPVHDLDAEGNTVVKVVFPWAEFSYDNGKKKKSRVVSLLKNIPGKSGEENLNISQQTLEYEMTNALRVLTDTTLRKVAFIEGHGEIDEAHTFSVTKALSEYYQVDRGVIGDDASVLDDYEALIVAGPSSVVSEKDKYAIDQYVMGGGKVMWLVDGVRIAKDSLESNSETAAIAMENGLDDMLFRYGVRINKVLLQDVQCAMIPVSMVNAGGGMQPAPWYYQPILITNPFNVVSRNVSPVLSDFCSSIDFVGDSVKVRKDALLITSTSTHVQTLPCVVSMDAINIEKSGYYFNRRNQVVGATLEGRFTSMFKNRIAPDGIRLGKERKEESEETRMVVVSDADIIRNEVRGSGRNAQATPLGYHSYMNQQFGNGDFVLNCVNYLTDEEGWMELRGREIKLRLLNKTSTIGMRKFWQVVNVCGPLLVLGIFAGVYLNVRRRKYAK